MKHRPQLPDDSVNVSRTHPLREAAWLTGGLVAILVAVFYLSGFGVDFVAGRLPEDTGMALRPQIVDALSTEFGAPADGPRVETARQILGELLRITKRNEDQVELLVIDNPQVNALAAPGGVIVVFTGLLDVVASENELAMVLGHELGHLSNRDHLRMLGRRLVTAGIAALVFGRTSSLDAQLLSAPTQLLQFRHSRDRERAADRVGVELLCALYGHGGGAEDFFRRTESAVPAFLATHPSSPDRIARIGQWRREIGCPEGETRLLSSEN